MKHREPHITPESIVKVSMGLLWGMACGLAVVVAAYAHLEFQAAAASKQLDDHESRLAAVQKIAEDVAVTRADVANVKQMLDRAVEVVPRHR